jgi:hypothetical protein
MIIDSDGHLYEPPDMRSTHMPASERHLALGTHWLPPLLRRLDNSYRIHAYTTGRELTPGLEMTPSAYIRRQVLNVCTPLDEYRSLLGEMDDDLSELFYGANMARVLQIA